MRLTIHNLNGCFLVIVFIISKLNCESRSNRTTHYNSENSCKSKEFYIFLLYLSKICCMALKWKGVQSFPSWHLFYNGILEYSPTSFYLFRPVSTPGDCMERGRGFEPPRPAWKAGMLAVEHQPRIGPASFVLSEGSRKQSLRLKSNYFILYHLYHKRYSSSREG